MADRLTRRGWLASSLALVAASVFVARRLGAAPAEPEPSPERRRLDNRLELWSSYAKRTENLLGRYTSERVSSLLYEPLIGSGQLAFTPGTLVLRDDGATGSTTRISPDGLEIRPNDPSVTPRALEVGGTIPLALAWLSERLLACFTAGDGQALIADARAEAPRGQIPRLVILPHRGSPARLVLRSLTLTLDPVGGAITKIVIAEADGGEFRLALVECQQNVEPDAIARVVVAPL